MGEKVKNILNGIAKFASLVLLGLMLFLYFYTLFNGKFIPANIMIILRACIQYVTIGVIGCLTLSFASDKGLIAFIAVAVLVAALVIASFFPNVFNTLLTYAKV